jgi:hypothetical protein
MTLRLLGTLTLLVTVGMPLAAVAQEEEEAYIYATYFYCNTATQEKADELVTKNSKAIYDAAVKDGTITGWGWLAHHTGGQWRRLQYHMSDSVSGLLKAQDILAERMEAAGIADDGFSEICNAHDDYIWQVEAGKGITGKRSKAGLSVYQICDIGTEERADEIVDTVFAPIYNKAVEDGKITSWGWSSHVLGGKYRRLGTMTADSFDQLLKARAEILEAIYADGENKEAAEFSMICDSHSDYLWEIQHENRG